MFKRVMVSDSVLLPKLESVLKKGHFDVLDTSASIASALTVQYGIGAIQGDASQ
ncbi:hypothetical protein D9M68_1007460 [compost metagenome]